MTVTREKKFAVIGDPVEQSLSPLLHGSVFRMQNIPGRYEKILVTAQELPRFMARFRNGELDGINVTIPHKFAVMPFLDELNPKASIIGSVNCILQKEGRLTGYNTDWFGFIQTLKMNHIQPAGKVFILLGAGGSAYSVAYALLQSAAGAVFVVNRTREKAESLVASLSHLSGCTVFQPAQLEDLTSYLNDSVVIVNTTPLGMGTLKDETPFPPHLLRPGHTFVDIIYNPLQTKILKLAEETGAQTINGLEMFIYQGLASLDVWLGRTVSSRIPMKRIKTILEAKL